jgi:hypothetical protein
MRKRIKRFFHYYRIANRNRWDWISWKWRVFAVLVAAVVILYVSDYLTGKYFGIATTMGHAAPFIISEKIFYWFMTGFFLGMIVVTLIFEGEFVLGIRKLARHLEKEALAGIKALEKPLKTKAKKRK